MSEEEEEEDGKSATSVVGGARVATRADIGHGGVVAVVVVGNVISVGGLQERIRSQFVPRKKACSMMSFAPPSKFPSLLLRS